MKKSSKSIYIKTYGCQMNERDSEHVAQSFVERGHTLTASEQDADVILLNTCSVREQAEQKAIGKMGLMRKLRRARPSLVLGYLGCMAQSRAETLLKESPHINFVLGTQKFHRAAETAEKFLADPAHPPIVDVAPEEGSQNTICLHTEALQPTAFVSIMQGCDMRCSFCIVPHTRANERSRPIADIVDEVTQLARRGTREITLLGQIVNRYARRKQQKGGKSPFVQLLDAISAVPGIARIRFASPHPIGFGPDLVEAFTLIPQLVEHVHLPLQSGSDRILRAMKRGYTAETFVSLAERLRAAQQCIAITTDIIVGFPGETEEDFAETVEVARRVDFDNAFIFRYSPRADTHAATLPGQLDEAVKEDRNQRLLALINEGVARRLDALVGTEVEILCEGPSRTTNERLVGRTRTNKIAVFRGDATDIGKIFNVKVVQASTTTLYCEK